MSKVIDLAKTHKGEYGATVAFCDMDGGYKLKITSKPEYKSYKDSPERLSKLLEHH